MRRVAKEGAKAVAGVENGASHPSEGEVTQAEMVEGRRGGWDGGGERCTVRDRGGVGCAEELFVLIRCEGVGVPKVGEVIIS